MKARRLDVKKRYSEEQIIGLLKEADAGLPVKELCRRALRQPGPQGGYDYVS